MMHGGCTEGIEMRALRQVIDGLAYDTEDAELIATAITLTESEDDEEILHSLYRSERLAAGSR
jgi:hypothetical protein